MLPTSRKSFSSRVDYGTRAPRTPSPAYRPSFCRDATIAVSARQSDDPHLPSSALALRRQQAAPFSTYSRPRLLRDGITAEPMARAHDSNSAMTGV